MRRVPRRPAQLACSREPGGYVKDRFGRRCVGRNHTDRVYTVMLHAAQPPVGLECSRVSSFEDMCGPPRTKATEYCGVMHFTRNGVQLTPLHTSAENAEDALQCILVAERTRTPCGPTTL